MSKKKSKSETKPWSPAQPYLLGAANQISDTVSSHQPQLDALAGNITSQLPQFQNMAFGEQPGIPQGIDYAKDVLGGSYLNNNPYVQQQAQTAGNDAANHVNATFSMAGRTGSNAHAYDLARGVTAAELPILNQNYQNERGLQGQAASLLPALNQARYAGVQPDLAATQLAGQLPFYGVGNLSAIGSLFSPYGTTTQSQPWGPMVGGILGAGLSGWASGGFKT